jgi:predicted thioredoxin/glutaredoxin
LRKVELGLVEKFVLELGKAWLINKVIEAGLTPILTAIQKEVTATGPVGGLDRAMALTLQRMQQRQKELAEKRKAAAAKAGAR